MYSEKIKKLEKRISSLSKTLSDLENSYEEKVHELSFLRKIGDLLIYVFDIHEACQKIVDLLYDEMLPDNCSILLLNHQKGELELFAVESKTTFDIENESYILEVGKKFKLGEGVAGWVLEQKQVVYIPDTSLDERFIYFEEMRVEIQSLICIPLLNQDKPEGVINISYCKKHAVPVERIHFLNILMNDVGLAIGNIRLFDELKETNRSLQETNENLRQTFTELHKTQQYIFNSLKMSGISVLAAGIAHEFNNIFAAIMGYSELSLLSTDIEENKKSFKAIFKLSNRALQVIKKLLDFAGRHQITKTKINIHTELQSIVNLVKSELTKNCIEVKTSFGKTSYVVGDINQISQVFLHLISNARDSMEDGGTLSISTRQTDNCVEITFEDTGKGIEPSLLKNIFDPFVTTKGAFGGGEQPGLGLGLSAAYGIIKSHEGDIDITSEVGSGTKVTVRLPLHKSNAKPSKKANR